ncbi:hypothetical protein AOLI_G00298660 [Acnodon oligacanthus]
MSAWPAQLAPPQSVDPNVDTFPAPVIRLTLSGSEHYALVDTGSGLSLITEECCKAFPAQASQSIRKAAHKRHFGLSRCHLSSHPYDYGPTDLTHHAIHTSDAKPIKLRPHRTSPATQVLLQQEVDKLLEQGIIEESHSPWSAPVVVVVR